MIYYNEFDPYAAQWLCNLAEQGLVPGGQVDDRSIRDVQPKDLGAYDQCHFFAGIGGWSYALALAGWPATRPVWTGSCPCQPFSAAGKRKGTADDRHLWPEFLRLITACKPATVFGEQVASKDGREWLAGVRTDLEALGYEVGAADLCAASVGAPHIRQRLFWVADANGGNAGAERQQRGGQQRQFAADGYAGDGLAYAEDANGRPQLETGGARSGRSGLAGSREDGGMEHTPRDGRQQRRPEPIGRGVEPRCGDGGLGDTASEQARLPRQPWGQSDTVPCSDGNTRRIEPGTFPLAHGVSNRVGKLRAYGNAIVPQVAAQFISAYLMVPPPGGGGDT